MNYAMNNGRKWIGILVVAVAGLAAVGGGLYFRYRRIEQRCWVCQRPLHADNIVVAELDDQRHEACCPACVLAMRAQTGKKVRIVTVTDYLTHQPLAPEQATYVVASDVNTCAQHSPPHLDEEKRARAVHYDRCTPSILAFRSKPEAEDFAKQHGGNVGSLADLGIRQ